MVSIQLRHSNVQEGHVGPECLQGAQGSLAVTYRLHFVPPHSKQHRQGIGGIHVVISHQEALHRRGRRAAGTFLTGNWLSGGSVHRQPKQKLAALTQTGTLCLDRAPMKLN